MVSSASNVSNLTGIASVCGARVDVAVEAGAARPAVGSALVAAEVDAAGGPVGSLPGADADGPQAISKQATTRL